MNPRERLERRLRGEAVDRVPNHNIMMTFAAHYIGQPLRAYYLDARVLAEANVAVTEAFDLDLVQTISDPYREAADVAEASGEPDLVHFPEDGLPIMTRPFLAEPGDLARLVIPEPSRGRRMADRLEATRLLRERLGPDVPILGWVEGALAEAADLRGVGNLLTDLYDRPEWVEELLERCVELAIAFARAQVEAGADIIGLGDAIASQVAPRVYRTHALPYEQRIFSAVHEAGALARLHICGDTTRLLGHLPATGADIIDVDWMVDMGAAARTFGPQGPAPCGNMDPVAVMLQGTPDDVERAVAACLAVGGPRSISAAGCEIPDGTPPENLLAHARALRQAGD